jgi:hypothetical protein
MNVEIFAEWLRRQGHQVERTESSYWVNRATRVYLAFPYHWLIQPAEAELQEFIQSRQALSLRYSTSLEMPVGFDLPGHQVGSRKLGRQFLTWSEFYFLRALNKISGCKLDLVPHFVLAAQRV